MRNKIYLIFLSILIILLLEACGGTTVDNSSSESGKETKKTEEAKMEETTTEVTEEKMVSYEMNGCHYSLPEVWQETQAEDDHKIYKTNDATLQVLYAASSVSVKDENTRKEILTKVSSGENVKDFKILSDDKRIIDNYDAYGYSYNITANDINFYITTYMMNYNKGIVLLSFSVDRNVVNERETCDDYFSKILDSVTFDEVDDDSTEEENSLEKDGIISFMAKNFSVEYEKYETAEDYEGNKVLLYYYKFTNNSEENLKPATSVSFTAFQNGIECDKGYLLDAPEEYGNGLKEIQPGATIEACAAFVIKDKSDVTIEAKPYLSRSNDKDTQIIQLK